jgi:CRISPR system Cascade subunit CasD
MPWTPVVADPYLLLWLEGPLQAWGEHSKFGRRDSLGFPSKSGVLGLVCCALGAGGEQRERLAALAGLDMQVMSYQPCDQMGTVRSPQPPLCDFQMVGSGYDEGDPWQRLLVPKTRDGKRSIGGGARMTHRHYLQDAAFAVALQVPAAQAKEIACGLLAPVWDIYLGRKSCAPSELIYQGCFAGIGPALRAAQALAALKQRAPGFRVRQGEHEGDILTLNDVPLQFGLRKRYRDRKVTVQICTPE